MASAAAQNEGTATGQVIVCKGLLVPYTQARMASRSQGVIESIRDEGEFVKAGEVVMKLESGMEELQVAQQEHILALRDFEWKSADELRRKNVVSATEGEEKRITLEVAKVQLAQARELLSRRTVVAPFDGVVAEQLREVGEAVDEFVPVLVLVDVNTLALEVFLPASRLREIREGQPVTVRIPGEAEKSFQGRVDKVAPVVNAASGDFKVRIVIPNKEGDLVAGTPATAEIQPSARH